MSTLIEGLLNYSRVTTKAQPFEVVDLAKVAQDVVSDLHRTLRVIAPAS